MTALPERRFCPYEGRADGLSYLEWPGSDRRSFVCVHGIGGAAATWSPFAPRLRESGRVLALDLPGHGRSPKRRGGGSLQGAGHALEQFLSIVARPPVTLIAESFGGAVAIATVARDHASVEAIALSSSYLPPVLGGRKAPLVLGALACQLLGIGGRRAMDRLLETPASSGPKGAARANPTRQPALRPIEIAGIASLAFLSLSPRRARTLFGAVSCPVLVMHGEEDPLVPIAWARAAVGRHQNWELVAFPSVSHLVTSGRPELWVDHVRSWVETLP